MNASKRETLRAKRRKRQQNQRLFLIIGVAVVVIAAAAIIILPGVIAAAQPIGPITQITPGPAPQANGLSMGNPKAPVKFQEFADFQCPYCKEFAQNYQSAIVEKYVATGQVYYTYVPFSFIGPESTTAAEAAYCAADQGKFWAYHDMLFANQGAENSGVFSNNRLVAFAKALGLDTGTFQSCLTSNKYASKVQQDLTDGEKLGVTQTPSFAINGKLITVNNLSDVETAVANAVAGKAP
ncbi:MAG: DsbA family protein [Chloroflexi bacterium]|nr:DsbA family protein [Chloroflexota bacterium]